MGDLGQGMDAGEVPGGGARTPVPVLSLKERPLVKGQRAAAGSCTAWLHMLLSSSLIPQQPLGWPLPSHTQVPAWT